MPVAIAKLNRYQPGMISVVVPTLNAAPGLAPTLTALVSAAVEGLVREVIVVDGGSSDETIKIADAMGADIVRSPPGRGVQLVTGAGRARSSWLLFLHADTVLEHGWEREVSGFMAEVDQGMLPPSAACFRFALDDRGIAPRLLEAAVQIRCRLLGLPYGDQGLLIPRAVYDAIGGYKPIPLMEDVDIVQRIPRGGLVVLQSRAMTSSRRYKRDGYLHRSLRNLLCLGMYYIGFAPERIAQTYAPEQRRPNRAAGINSA